MIKRDTPPLVYPMGTIELPAVQTETLENGIELSMYDGGAWDANQLVMIYRGGESEGAESIAKLSTALLCEGAGSMSGTEISEALDFRGANFASFTTAHHSALKLSALNSMSEGLFPLLREMILCPTFPERAFDVYVENAVAAKRMNMAKVSYRSHQAMKPLIMGRNNPQAYDCTEEDIRKTKREELFKYHSDIFKGSGSKACLSGRITDALYQDVRGFLESLPIGEETIPLNMNPFEALAPQEVLVDMPESLQSSVSIGFPAPSRAHPDYIPLRFAVIALGGYFGSRLVKNIREDKGYTYGIHSGLFGQLDGSYVMIGAQTDSRYVRLLIEEVGKELEKMINEPITEEEMTRLRRNIESGLMETLDSPFTVMNHYTLRDLYGVPADYLANTAKQIQALTPDVIMEMAAKYLRPEKMRIAIAGNAAKM